MDSHSIGILLGGLFAGVICGLGPFVVGLRRHCTGLGVAGLITCIACGSALGIRLAAPVAILWTLVLLRSRRRRRRQRYY